VSTENDQFLARWSRRKQEAKAVAAAPGGEQATAAQAPTPVDGAAAQPLSHDRDVACLPPIDAIDAATDITAFLRQGIPQELSRAALRRAWSADPAIRDFVGLAENAWDFNDPNAMPGFGPLDLSATQVDALVRRIVGGVVQSAGHAGPVAETGADAAPSVPVAVDAAPASHQVEAPACPPDEAATAELPTSSAAPQLPTESANAPARRRNHGGALPR